jgi:Sulfotransferase domain/N-terminal domain of galactosyltransferase
MIIAATTINTTPTTPCIVFCTTCKGRAQHVEQTLLQNIADNIDYPNCKFIILDYDSRDYLGLLLRAQLQRFIDAGLVVAYRFPGQFPNDTPFHMAHAKNMAHRAGMLEGADILVNLDADNYTGAGFARYLADQFTSAASRRMFMWSKMARGQMTRGISGRIAVTPNAFVNVGGYDERYRTWAPDDKDFNHRLQRLGYKGVEIDPQFLLGVPHNDRMRFKEYPQAATTMDSAEFDVSQSDSTVANFGQIGCGLVFRNFDYDHPIYLAPLPTRVFGIGMHKTATTSLHTALTILGIDSAHWEDAHWAKAIWTEMQAEGRSLTLERHYALCDLPITLLYAALDKAYPGSKFILTVRDEKGWLKSAEDHWSYRLNKYRATWDTDPFTHRIHNALYGRKTFDAEVFVNKFRQHNSDVLKYFRNRPNDLLVLDVDKGHGWRELCEFLGKPIPQVPYPIRLTGGDVVTGYVTGHGDGI